MAVEQSVPLTIGTPAPDFNLRATDGQTYSLASFGDTPLLAIVFLANHCPYVGAWEDRLLQIARDYAGQVAFAAISSSDAEKFPKDSFEEMQRRAAEKEYPFPYLYDESQDAARSYGATRTPEVFLLDNFRRLRYHGAIDSDWEENEGVEPYLHTAIEGLLTGEEVTAPETKPVGCSLKLRT